MQIKFYADSTVIYNYGKEFLKTKENEGKPLTSKECIIFYAETIRPDWEDSINKKKYVIIEMENCN